MGLQRRNEYFQFVHGGFSVWRRMFFIAVKLDIDDRRQNARGLFNGIDKILRLLTAAGIKLKK